MTREEVTNIHVGQIGLYAWDKSLAIVSVEPLQFVLIGPDRGKVFRYVRVASATGNATIGFTVKEGSPSALH